jgi:hypothetical protein
MMIVAGLLFLLAGVVLSLHPIRHAAQRSEPDWPTSPRFRIGMGLVALGTVLITAGALGVG